MCELWEHRHGQGALPARVWVEVGVWTWHAHIQIHKRPLISDGIWGWRRKGLVTKISVDAVTPAPAILEEALNMEGKVVPADIHVE